MRSIVPVFLVILGLGAAEFADNRLQGGLANADRHDISYLVSEGVIACYQHAPPQVQRFLRESYANTRGGRGLTATRQHRDRHTQHIVIYRQEHPASRRATQNERVRLRGFGQKGQTLNMEPPIEVKFEVPVKEVAEATARRESKGSRRRR